MPTFGGFGGWPRKFGGSSHRAKIVYESLNAARGTAYDTSDDSTVTAETYAEAIVLDAAWSINRKMTLQWDPRRMSDFIPRWEAIFDLHPSVNASDNTRREAIASRFLALTGVAPLLDTVRSIAGDNFLEIIYTPLADAVPRWPENGYPNSWTSNVAHILVRLQFLSTQTLAEFWNVRMRLTRRLDDFLPAWVTFDIGTLRPDGVSEGFFLDERNLNYEVFAL